jgi:hypothetical protein
LQEAVSSELEVPDGGRGHYLPRHTQEVSLLSSFQIFFPFIIFCNISFILLVISSHGFGSKEVKIIYTVGKICRQGYTDKKEKTKILPAKDEKAEHSGAKICEYFVIADKQD